MPNTVYSPVIGAQKSVKNMLIQAVIWGIGLLIANPQVILNLIGEWQTMTLGGLIVYALTFAYNWLKNKNPN